jgi:hypothetical protein
MDSYLRRSLQRLEWQWCTGWRFDRARLIPERYAYVVLHQYHLEEDAINPCAYDDTENPILRLVVLLGR